ncbi:hypothetical protein C2G38_2041630 [Gigaspora rosea]|uniref:Uncharacterized protein n=1 Tax=Gigaspora rosea TaxID=44941 RepID=A0A397UZP1_9GLOM|nr:hypothetical protein C2G38_2041630 [Gigaspora rosea]
MARSKARNRKIKKKLQGSHEDMIVIRNLYEKEFEDNRVLTDQWNMVAQSKLVINIDNHITSCGSYNRFLKWQDELLKQEELLPDGLLFVAFDNKQKGQKNYLDRGFNMIKLDELFNISAQMQEVIDEELRSYLAKVLKLLSEEKLLSTNIIDSLVASTPTYTAKMKTCPSCNLKTIKNKKNDQIAKRNYPRWLKSKKSKAIDLKRYAICQCYHTENQLSYFKKCADHHNSWDSICSTYR